MKLLLLALTIMLTVSPMCSFSILLTVVKSMVVLQGTRARRETAVFPSFF
jgi:hypothetical protein